MLNRTSHAWSGKNRNMNWPKMVSGMGRQCTTARHLHQLRQESLLADNLSSHLIARATSSPSLHSTSRLRTLATTVFVRRVATRTGKESLLPQTKEVNEVEPLTLGDFRSDVTTLIDREVKESSTVLDPAAQYMNELGYQLVISNNIATLKRTQGKQVIEVSFAVEEEDAVGEEDRKEEDEEEEEEEAEGDEPTIVEVDEETLNEKFLRDISDLYIPTEVKISIVDKMNKEVSSMSLTCSAHEGRFFIDTLYSTDGQKAVHFELFSESLQEKIYEYLESIKLDHNLGTFISEYARNYHTHKNAQVLGDLKQFVSHLSDE